MLPSWQNMTARLDSPEGRKLYRQRSATIEPVFAQLTARLGRTLHYRGSLIDAELVLWAASHNILKAITARTKQLARQARTATTAGGPGRRLTTAKQPAARPPGTTRRQPGRQHTRKRPPSPAAPENKPENSRRQHQPTVEATAVQSHPTASKECGIHMIMVRAAASPGQLGAERACADPVRKPGPPLGTSAAPS